MTTKWRIALTFAGVSLMILSFLPTEYPVLGQLADEDRVRESESAAVNAVRALNTAIYRFRANYPNEGFAFSLQDLGPGKANFVSSDLVSGRKEGYVFVLIPGRTDEAGKRGGYVVLARPEIYGKTGKRSFLTDQSGIIRQTTEDRDATQNDPAITG